MQTYASEKQRVNCDKTKKANRSWKKTVQDDCGETRFTSNKRRGVSLEERSIVKCMSIIFYKTEKNNFFIGTP